MPQNILGCLASTQQSLDSSFDDVTAVGLSWMLTTYHEHTISVIFRAFISDFD